MSQLLGCFGVLVNYLAVDTSKHPRRLDCINILFIKSLDYVGVVNKIVVDISFTFDVINIKFIPRQIPTYSRHKSFVSSNVSQTGYREMKMRNGRRVVLAVLNLDVEIKIRVATFDCNHPVIGITQTVNRCFNPEAS